MIIKKLFLVMTILPVYIFTMESRLNQLRKISPILATIQLQDGGTEEIHINGMIERSSKDKTIIELQYPHLKKKLSNIHIKITDTELTLADTDPAYVANYNKLPADCAFGAFIRNGEIVKTIVYPDESFIEDSKTYFERVTDINKIDKYTGKLEQYKKIKYTDKINNTTKSFGLPKSQFTPDNPIAEYMKTRNHKISQNIATSGTNNTSMLLEIEDTSSSC